MRIARPIACIFILSVCLGPLKAWAADELLCSTFPVYLFTQAVSEGREAYEVKLMLDSALGCPHDYAPTPAELERLSRARVLVINGLGLESFLGKALTVARPDLRVLNSSGGQLLMDRTAAIKMAVVFGRGHDHDGHGHDKEIADAHLFASPESAAKMIGNIAEGLAAVDPDGAAVYRANAEKRSSELRALAARMKEAGDSLGKPKVFVSHSIFNSLAAGLNLTVVAAIEEEDGAEPSAARLAALAQTARREGVRAILIDPSGNRRLAETLGAEAKIPVVTIDPVASGPPEAGADYYLKVMNANLESLLKVLGDPEGMK